MKHCGGCQRDLPTTAFGPDRRRPDGLNGRCRECRNATAASAYAARPRLAVKARARAMVYAAEHPGLGAQRASAWQRANRERHQVHVLVWQDAHRGKVRQIKRDAQARRNARARGGGDAAVAYREILVTDPCAYCGAAAGTVDHIEPIAEGGVNTWDNLTAACQPCNSGKGTRPLLTYLLETIMNPSSRTIVRPAS